MTVMLCIVVPIFKHMALNWIVSNHVQTDHYQSLSYIVNDIWKLPINDNQCQSWVLKGEHLHLPWSTQIHTKHHQTVFYVGAWCFTVNCIPLCQDKWHGSKRGRGQAEWMPTPSLSGLGPTIRCWICLDFAASHKKLGQLWPDSFSAESGFNVWDVDFLKGLQCEAASLQFPVWCLGCAGDCLFMFIPFLSMFFHVFSTPCKMIVIRTLINFAIANADIPEDITCCCMMPWLSAGSVATGKWRTISSMPGPEFFVRTPQEGLHPHVASYVFLHIPSYILKRCHTYSQVPQNIEQCSWLGCRAEGC